MWIEFYLIGSKFTNKPPPLLLLASINTLLKTDFGQARGTKLLESPITDSTSFGFGFFSMLLQLFGISPFMFIPLTLEHVQEHFNLFYSLSLMKYYPIYQKPWHIWSSCKKDFNKDDEHLGLLQLLIII